MAPLLPMHARQLVARLGMAAPRGFCDPLTLVRSSAGTTPTGSPAPRCSHISAHSGPKCRGDRVWAGMAMVSPAWPGLTVESLFTRGPTVLT